MEHSLELQKFHYFDEGNAYAGQKTKDPDSGLLLSQMLEKLKNKASLVELNRSAFEKGFALVRPGGNE